MRMNYFQKKCFGELKEMRIKEMKKKELRKWLKSKEENLALQKTQNKVLPLK